MKVFKNKWFILFVSILNGFYTLGLCYFAYAAMFYKIEFTNTVKFAVVYSVISVIVGLFMFYTRKSVLTCVSVVVVVAVLADADASDETEPMVPVPVTFTRSALMNPLVFASTNT